MPVSLMQSITATIAAVGVLTGCSVTPDPKAATKENFATAINAWISKHPLCVSPSSINEVGAHDSWPRRVSNDIPLGPAHDEVAKARESNRASFDALVQVGLLNTKTTTVQTAGVTLPAIEYNLTAEGKKAIAGDQARFHSEAASLCYGRPVVDEVDDFTAPAAMYGGVTVSHVSYRYHVTDIPAWARDARVQAAFPRLAHDIPGPLDGQATVALMGQGWMHADAASPGPQ